MCARPNVLALNRQVLQTAAFLVLAVMLLPAQPTVSFTTYPIPVIGASNSITVGPDGAFWIAHWNRIFRMTTAGALTTYPVPFGGLNEISAADITPGPDGALWFTGSGIAKIVRITTAGAFTAYDLPGGDRSPQKIVTGPDGALWFTEYIGAQGKIGRITTAGAITEYELSPCHSTCGRYPHSIEAGPDGALWFTDVGDGRIHRITTTGIVTDYGTLGSAGSPVDITVGPDGALWFASGGNPNDRIGRITTSGVMTMYSLPIYDRPTYNGYNNLAPGSITTGPDGALWFTAARVNVLGRITTEGDVTLYRLPPISFADESWVSRGMTLGPDGALWITNDGMVVRAAIEQPDNTPPAITPQISGTRGNNGWYRGHVTVSWSVSDPESGIAASSGCNPVTLTTDTPGVTLTCSATNGAGLTNSISVTIKIDSSPPRITGMPGAGCSLWPPNHKLVQVADVKASDALSGLAAGSFRVNAVSNEPSPPREPDIVVSRGASGGFVIQLRAERLGGGNGRVYTVRATATDNAGNSATATSTCIVPHDRAN
jgi:virginiamycin B lyase